MRIRMFVEPQQGSTYDELLSAAQAAEAANFDAFFRSDHYLKIGDIDGLPGPTDAWVSLAGLARDTADIRLGTLLSAATFRHPGPLAVMVAQVDAMSGGRIELGLGSGWYEAEHAAFGIPFPPARERFERLEEQLAVVTGLWSAQPGSSFSFEGRHYRLDDNPALPKPLQRPRPPIIVGGTGRQRTSRLAALYADEFNMPFGSPEATAAQFLAVRRSCESVGRDPATIRLSVAVTVCCGRNRAEIEAREAAVTRRASDIGREHEDLRHSGACGTPREVADRLRLWRDAGADTLYLQIMDHQDLDQIELLGHEVLPSLT